MKRYDKRSEGPELIDDQDVPIADWEMCLKELNVINSLLGGHNITVKGVSQLLPGGKRAVTIAEIGCGGGDNLKAIDKWNNGRFPIKYIGIDLNKACIDFAYKNCRGLADGRFICSDYKNVNFGDNLPDIIFSSLFCHHFSDWQLVEMLGWLRRNTEVGFFINDLQRHPIAFYSIRTLTRLFSRSYLVRNDAPVSVMRGFKKSEWKRLLNCAGILNYSIQWRWAFRYLVISKNK